MNFRNTLIFLLVFAILLGAFLLFRGKKTEKTSPEKKISETYAITREDVTKIRLSFKDEATKPFTIAKDKGDKWQITEPITAQSDQDKVEVLLDDLLNKRVKRTLENAENLSQFGLDQPTVQIKLWTNSAEPYKTFLIGNETVGYSVYIKEQSDDAVITVESSVLTDFSKPYTAFREDTIVDFALSDVAELTLRYPDKPSITCERNAENRWLVDVPVKAKADNEKINDILDALKNLKVKVFEADGKKLGLSLYRLDKPRVEAVVVLGEDNSPQTLLVGAEVPNTNRVYVKRKTIDSVYSVNKDIVAKLTHTVYDVRDKTVIDFQRTEVNKFELQQDGQTIVCEKNDDGEWSIKQPVALKADSSEVDDLLFELDALKAKGFVDTYENLAQYGLDKPQHIVRLYEAGKAEPKVLLVGAVAAKQGNLVNVKTQDSDTIFRVGDKVLKYTGISIAELRDKLLLKFDSDDARKLELKHGDVAITCVKQGVNWRITIPSNEDADNSAVNSIISALAELKAKKFISDKLGTAITGLDAPQVNVTVSLLNNTAHTLSIGKATADNTLYAQLATSEDVFLLDDDIVTALKKTLEDLRQK